MLLSRETIEGLRITGLYATIKPIIITLLYTNSEVIPGGVQISLEQALHEESLPS